MASDPKSCCPLLPMVLSRAKLGDRTGLMWDTVYSLSGKPPREIVAVRFRRSKDRKAEHADATFAEVAFCPFCGATLRASKGRRS